MRAHLPRLIGAAAATLFFVTAGTAQAQGHGHDSDHGRGHENSAQGDDRHPDQHHDVDRGAVNYHPDQHQVLHDAQRAQRDSRYDRGQYHAEQRNGGRYDNGHYDGQYHTGQYDPRYEARNNTQYDPRYDARNTGQYDPRYDSRYGSVNGRRIPPGLARKPGGMPPGQYRKMYSTDQGAGVLREVLDRRGYPVVRSVGAGQSRYVYYQLPDGTQRRAIVSPGANQLSFSNVPSSLLAEVLSRFY